MDKKLIYGGVAVLVVLAILVLFYASGNGSQPASPGGNGAYGYAKYAPVAVQLTDPPHVPAGTSALVVSYTGVQAHVSNAGSASGWISSSASGSVDLLAILNLSKTIASVQVPVNATIDMVRFNVTSATITINGTTYNVTVPSSKITARVAGDSKISSSATASSSVLLDMSPVVASIITANSTVFVMVPSLKAVVIANGTTSASSNVGATVDIKANATVRERLDMGPNITITSASLAVNPNTNAVSLSVTVKDNSNESVSLRHVGLMGSEQVSINTTRLQADVNVLIGNITSRAESSGFCTEHNLTMNSTASASASGSASSNVTGKAGSSIHGYGGIGTGVSGVASTAYGFGSGFMLATNSSFGSFVATSLNAQVTASAKGSMHVNASSLCTAAGETALESEVSAALLNFSTEVRDRQNAIRVVVLTVNGTSGSLGLVWNSQEFGTTSGFTLRPGQSTTLSFTGAISAPSARITIAPVVGTSYKLVVQGEDAIATTTVTAARSG